MESCIIPRIAWLVGFGISGKLCALVKHQKYDKGTSKR